MHRGMCGVHSWLALRPWCCAASGVVAVPGFEVECGKLPRCCQLVLGAEGWCFAQGGCWPAAPTDMRLADCCTGVEYFQLMKGVAG
jgi:hypothetical protein